MPNVRELGPRRFQGSYRDAAGRRHTKVWPTRTAALRWAADGEAAVRQGTHRDPRAGRMLLRDWHARWLAARVVEQATARKDRTYARPVLARWGAVPLDAVLRIDVQAWVAALIREGRGPHAVQACLQQLRAVLDTAVTDGLIPANPAAGVRLPTVRPSPDRLILPGELTALLEHLPTRTHRRMVVVMADSGLRWGETAGLHTHRVDLLRREVHVVETLTQLGKVKATAKSRRSQRTVPLSDRACVAVRDAIAEHGEAGLVFRTTGLRPGKVMYAAQFRRAWDGACERAGLVEPHPTVHDLRHTWASRMLAAGVDLPTVQAMLGHESVAVTARYSHVTSGAPQRIREALRDLG